MSDLSSYDGNQHWQAQYRLALKCPNHGFYSNEFIGTPGMHSPMFITANESYYIQMAHGTQTPNPYSHVGIMGTCPPRNPSINPAISQCADRTVDPMACISQFLQYPTDSHKYPPIQHEKYRHGWPS